MPPPRKHAARPLALALLLLALPAATCGATCGQSALGIMPGVVNNPANLSLRRAILSWGQSQICAEVQKRSVPLRLRDDDPATGRFFPTACFAQELSNGNLMIQLGGFGYVWTNLTKRMGFEASAGVEYEQDFLMDGGTMYVYFRQRSTTAASFTTRMIEQPAALPLGTLPLAQGSALTNALGTQLMRSEIARGFTVIRDDDGSVQLGLGVVEKGKRPPEPYNREASKKLLLANERTEVHQQQQDFIGPVEGPGDGEALSLTVNVDGAPAVDLLIVPRGPADPWLQAYTSQPAPAPPPTSPLLDQEVPAGAVFRRTVALPRGFYYLVIDNTSVAGRTQPSMVAQDDRAALVSYAVQIGDAP